MPVLKLYPNGLTGGVPPTFHPNRLPPAVRDDCKGWSLKSSRSNTRFLYSVLAGQLPQTSSGEPLIGLALSLTVRDLPPTHDDWKLLRERFLKRLRDKGLYRLHWLTEWQRRGVPHLHAAAWFPLSDVLALGEKMGYQLSTPLLVSSLISCLVKSDWLQCTACFGSTTSSQHVESITGELGWLKYLSKHASRGAAHYQRALGTIPAGWQKTGRMWGYLGDWPTCEPHPFDLDNPGWYRFRRIVRGWRLAQARREPNGRRILSARRMLRCSDPALSAVRGVSEWIDLRTGLQVVRWLERSGYPVNNHVEDVSIHLEARRSGKSLA